MDRLSDRQEQVLRATVHHYVDTVEPVSSATLVKRFGLEASSSTVRSAMGALSQRGLLTQPHASSGRVPSAQGYRHYVDCLLPPPAGALIYLQKELTNLSFKWAARDDLLFQLAKRLTDFTGLMSLIIKPVRQKDTLQQVRLVRNCDRMLIMLVESSSQTTNLNVRLPLEGSLDLEVMEIWLREQLSKSGDGSIEWLALPTQLQFIGSIVREALQSHSQGKISTDRNALFHGISRLVDQPEFRNSNRFIPLLELIDNRPASVVPIHENPMGSVWIGHEHPHHALTDCSVVEEPFRTSNEGIGHVALVGPMRMAYATSKAAVKMVANHLETVLS